MHSCKNLGKPVRQVREPSEGSELRHSFSLQETVNWSTKLTFSRERWWRIAPVNVRSVSEKHNAVRQADSGFGGRCSRKSGGTPEAWSYLCISGPFLMTFATGRIPHAGSRQVTFMIKFSIDIYKTFLSIWSYIVLFLFSLFFLWMHHAICMFLVPWPSIEPIPPAGEAQSPHH